jgi:ABC-2 type transport system permease protein
VIARVQRLVRFEWRKLFARRFTWIALLAVALAAAISPATGQVLAKAEQLTRGSPADVEGMSGWAALASGLRFGTYVATFVILILAGSAVSEEVQQGTLKTLLLRPVRRTDVLLSKMVALSIFSVLLVLVMGAASGLAACRYDFGSLVSQGGKDAATLTRYTAGAFGLALAPLFSLVAFGLLFSCAIDHPGQGTGAAIGGYFVLSAVAGLTVAAKKWFFVYYVALPFEDLFDMGGGVSAAAKEFREHAPLAVEVPLASALVLLLGAALLLRMRDIGD